MRKSTKHCKCCIWSKICNFAKFKIGEEIPLHQLKVGMKVFATSPFKKVTGKVSDIGKITFAVWDGETNWGFFFDEPSKARVYKLS